MSDEATEKLGIDFEITHAKQLLDLMRQIADQAIPTGQAIKNMAGNVPSGKSQNVAIQSGQSQTVAMTPGNLTITVKVQGGGSNSTTGNTATRRTPPVSRAKGPYGGMSPYGPFQRSWDLAHHINSGNLSVAQENDARIAMIANNKRIQKLNQAQQQSTGSPVAKAVMQALMTTRLHIGNASPLVGRSLHVFEAAGMGSAEAMAGPMLIVGALAAAIAGLWELAKSSAELGNNFNRLQLSTGSSTGTTANLQTLGASIGLTDDRMSSLANSLQQSITSDPMARAAGMRLGVFNLPGMFGQQDYGKQLTTVINNLRQITNPTERLALARQLGVEAILPMAMMSNKQFSHLAPDSAIRTGLMTGQFQQESADFQAALGRVGQALQNVLIALGPTVLPMIIEFLNELADGLQTLSQFIQANQGVISDFFKMFAVVLNPGAFGMSVMKTMPGGQAITDVFNQISDSPIGQGISSMLGITSNHTAALIDNTAATNANTVAVKAMIPGTYGYTRRDMNTAIPVGLNGQSIDRFALSLSAF